MSDQPFNVNGLIPEPVLDKHWDFESLKPKLASAHAGAVDLRPFSSPRHDQRHTSSCVAQSTVKALEIKRIMKHGHEAHVDLSVLAVYYLAREMMLPPQTHVDGGVYVSHACDVLRRFGACPEEAWPFDLSKVNMSPSWRAMRQAYLHKIDSFYRIRSTGAQRVADVLAALRSDNPVVYGTAVGDNWQGYRDGEILRVLPNENITGRHATVLVGWDGVCFIGENSWGESWGSEGFYLLAPEVIESEQASDFWVIQSGFGEYKP